MKKDRYNKRKLSAGTFIVCIVLSFVCAAAGAFAAEAGEVNIYSGPDHSYSVLSDYSDHITYNLPYCGEGSTDSQRLHLVFPSSGLYEDEKYPVLVFIHGGGWSALNSIDGMVTYTGESALWALQRGYAVAFVDYTLSDADHQAMPNQVFEMKAAVRFLRSVADEYRLDTDRIAVMGESAGGHLANMMGTTIGEEHYEYEAYGNMEYSSDVQAVITQYSVTDLSSLDGCLPLLYGVDPSALSEEETEYYIHEASPLPHVDGNEPPFFIESGLEDGMVPYTQSCSLYNAVMMANKGSNSVLKLFPGIDHGAVWFQTEENASLYLDWLDEVLGL